MKCPDCNTENPDSRKFCRECGSKFLVKCPHCNSKNLPGDKFCGECGKKLSVASVPPTKDLSFDEKLEKIQRYLPKGLTDKILSQRDRIEGERKQVTVMFCDMEGFTALSERIGPEEAYTIMDQVYEILIHKVHDYEGTVNEMTGDGIVALFGAPIALEDAPQRAIRSALAIHRAMVFFSDGIRGERKIQPVKMRIGVHTGPVVVGTVGNDLRVEFKAVGDTVNVASRIEEIAEPGTTYVSADTFKLTEGFFRFEGLGDRELKGKEKPVKVYRVLTPSTSRTRFDVSSERGLTPLVGRERELELLVDGLERAKTGRGQAFSIIAEAGLGKSRLLYEFRKTIANENVTFLEGKCLSYNRNVAYHPVIDILKSNFKIRESYGDFEIREKVKEGLRTLDSDEASTLPYLLDLLSVKESGIDKILLSPEEKKARTIEILIKIVLKGSELRPLIMVIEDLHWIDNSSEESLRYILEGISGARILLIFTYRPEFVHTWGGRSYHSQLNLMRLSNRESLQMVAFLLGTSELESNLAELILDKTEGVPFFIEELIRSLKDLKVIEKKDAMFCLIKNIKDIDIPSRIQDVIMARVDSLPEGAKDILQVGSVIGREFGHNLLKEVLENPEQELLSRLSVLKDSELLYERGIYPASTYIFKHALTQEAVYQSLLKSTYQKYHRMIAEALEQHFPEIKEAQPETLGHHFTEAGLADNAILYWKKAGARAVRRSSNIEAITHLNKGLDLLKILSDTPERAKLELDVTIALGSALIPAKGQGAPEVEHVYSRAFSLCQQIKDSSHIFPSLMGLCAFYQGRGQHQKPHELAKQILAHAQRKQDPALLLPAHYVLGISFFYLGELTKSKSHLEKIATYYTPQQDRLSILPHGTDPTVTSQIWVSWILWYLGYPEQARQKSQKACTLAEELSHPHTLVFVLLLASRVHQYRREGQATQELSEKILSLSIEHGFPLRIAAANFMRGWALAEQENRIEGIAQMHKGMSEWHSTGTKTNHTYFKTRLSETYGKEGQPEVGLNLITEALSMINESDERFCEAELHQIKGDLLLLQAAPDKHQAESCFQQALEVARNQQAKSLELRAAMSLSRLWQSQGKKEEAHNLLSEIYNWFTEGFDTADLKEAKALLEELS